MLTGVLLIATVGLARNDAAAVLDAALARYSKASSYEVVYTRRHAVIRGYARLRMKDDTTRFKVTIIRSTGWIAHDEGSKMPMPSWVWQRNGGHKFLVWSGVEYRDPVMQLGWWYYAMQYPFNLTHPAVHDMSNLWMSRLRGKRFGKNTSWGGVPAVEIVCGGPPQNERTSIYLDRAMRQIIGIEMSASRRGDRDCEEVFLSGERLNRTSSKDFDTLISKAEAHVRRAPLEHAGRQPKTAGPS